MTLLALGLAAGFVFFLGRFLVRRLGWPTDMEGAGRWGFTLLVLAVLFSAAPEIVRGVEKEMGAMPSVSLGELLPALVFVGLAVLGYVAWTRGAVERERRGKAKEHEHLLPRRRAAPPAPLGHEHGGHNGFHPLAPGDHDETPDGHEL